MSVDTDVVIDEKIETVIKEPTQYRVVFLNDDRTPMDFVVDVLVKIFRHSQETAEKVTLAIHNDGAGTAGIYSFEVAEQKGTETTELARANGFPLRVKIEAE